jgi:UDP:flavonoid glycosyltransferase YjiC (YdhE family)
MGVPLVVAGDTEDKAFVAARVAWTGAGISLRTSRPRPEEVRYAVREVLNDDT